MRILARITIRHLPANPIAIRDNGTPLPRSHFSSGISTRTGAPPLPPRRGTAM
jgi:hypothetical protein